MSEDARGWSLLGMLTELMSNQHRGHAGLRTGGGVHPVPQIGTEHGGSLPGERFDTRITEEQLISAIRDGILRADHVLPVRADGPFNGFSLGAHSFQVQQHTFVAVGATDVPTAVRIIGRNELRISMVIKVITLTGGSVYLGNSETVSAANGYPLSLGETITLPARCDVYGLSTSAAQAQLAILTTARDG